MSTPEFATAENNQELAQEVNCLKALLTLMLQAMGQADAGRVIIKMEKQIAEMEDQAESAVFANTVKQIKQVPYWRDWVSRSRRPSLSLYYLTLSVRRMASPKVVV